MQNILRNIKVYDIGRIDNYVIDFATKLYYFILKKTRSIKVYEIRSISKYKF